MKKYILLIFFVIAARQLCAQDKTWPQRKLLGESDYKEAPDPRSPQLGYTQLAVFYLLNERKPCAQKGLVHFTATTYTKIGSHSWIKPVAGPEQKKELLAHEQGHYDINLAFARTLKHQLDSCCFNDSSYKTQAAALYRTLFLQYDSLQLQYDRETAHMTNRKEQLRWLEYIRHLLQQYP